LVTLAAPGVKVWFWTPLNSNAPVDASAPALVKSPVSCSVPALVRVLLAAFCTEPAT
jgi:hypothetical protein